jgi:EEF1A lysine methyltransferase 4
MHAIFPLYNKTEGVTIDIARRQTKVLVIGCGNSLLSEQMYDNGYRNITNNDISPICINRMKQRNEKKRPEMKWDVMDVRKMTYQNGQFDVIIDKSTIDAILCMESPNVNAAIVMSEC